jgi:hypothetical protein
MLYRFVRADNAGVLQQGIGELIPVRLGPMLSPDGDALESLFGGFSLFGHKRDILSLTA